METSDAKVMWRSKDKINFLILVFCFTIYCDCGFAQYHPQYSQYMFNGMALNPAYAGSEEVLSLAALYRNSQWGNSVEGAPTTKTFTGNCPLNNPQIAIGLLIFDDIINMMRSSGTYFAYAYRVRAGDGKLSFGLQAGFDVQHEDQTLYKKDIIHPDDPLFHFKDKYTFMPNAGIGTYYYTTKFFAGLSIPQLLTYSPQYNKPDKYAGKLSFNKIMLYTGTIVPTSKDVKLKPSILLQKVDNGMLLDINCNVLLMKEILELGASWRTGSTFVAMAQFRKNLLSIGYAYDFAIGKPSAINMSHEIMLRYDLKIRIKAASPLIL